MMENDTLAPEQNGLADAASSLTALGRLASRRQNSGALRTIFGALDAQPKAAEPVSMKLDSSVQRPTVTSPPPAPRI
jgi:hypothetical protein